MPYKPLSWEDIGPAPPMPSQDEEEYKRQPLEMKRAWREWNRKKDDYIAEMLAGGANFEDIINPNSGDSFGNEKATSAYEGRDYNPDWRRWGPGGLFETMGPGYDPNYIWDKGQRFNVATTDRNAGWEAIPNKDWRDYTNWQQFKSGGGTIQQWLKNTGATPDMSNYNRNIQAGHWTADPTSGLNYDVGKGNPNDPSTWQWFDDRGSAAKSPYNNINQINSQFRPQTVNTPTLNTGNIAGPNWQTDKNYRPFKKQSTGFEWGDWGKQFGQQQSKAQGLKWGSW